LAAPPTANGWQSLRDENVGKDKLSGLRVLNAFGGKICNQKTAQTCNFKTNAKTNQQPGPAPFYGCISNQAETVCGDRGDGYQSRLSSRCIRDLRSKPGPLADVLDRVDLHFQAAG
jgi:hypothetical protein